MSSGVNTPRQSGKWDTFHQAAQDLADKTKEGPLYIEAIRLRDLFATWAIKMPDQETRNRQIQQLLTLYGYVN
jgi:hypothetical protein